MPYKGHIPRNSLLCNKFRIAVSYIRRYMNDIVCCFGYAFIHIISNIFPWVEGLKRLGVWGRGMCVGLDVWGT